MLRERKLIGIEIPVCLSHTGVSHQYDFVALSFHLKLHNTMGPDRVRLKWITETESENYDFTLYIFFPDFTPMFYYFLACFCWLHWSSTQQFQSSWITTQGRDLPIVDFFTSVFANANTEAFKNSMLIKKWLIFSFMIFNFLGVRKDW